MDLDELASKRLRANSLSKWLLMTNMEPLTRHQGNGQEMIGEAVSGAADMAVADMSITSYEGRSC